MTWSPKKKKKDRIQYISFNVKNTSAQKTDLRWEAMANICSVCSYGSSTDSSEQKCHIDVFWRHSARL